MINMRPSKVLKKLRAGEIVCSLKCNLYDSRACEIAALAGFDCIWTDMEHVPNDFMAIERQILAAKAHDADLLVRVSRGGYSDYIRPLEMDAAGIMVPHIMNLDDARRVVQMTRFPPIGRRPVDGGNADGGFCAIDFQEYLRQANQERFLIVQIEDPEPLPDLDAIAALDGIDMLFFGPGDFSQGIGTPGQWDNPQIAATRRAVAAAATRHGKFAGTVGSPANLPELAAEGYRFVNIGADVVALFQYCQRLQAEITNLQPALVRSIYGGNEA